MELQREEDVTKWPEVPWPDIHLHLVEKPSVYTREKLRAYESLDAYGYVISGHVQRIKHHDIDPEFCVLRANVLPSQRQGHKTELYDAWAIVNRKENYILTANCTSMAGDNYAGVFEAMQITSGVLMSRVPKARESKNEMFLQEPGDRILLRKRRK